MSEAPTPIESIVENVDALAVVRAWRSLDPTHAVPSRIEVLRRKEKSVVYRLPSVGHRGSDVIGKRCVPETASVERMIYADVLPRLPVSQLRYYGFVGPRAQQTSSWLFLDNAEGDDFDPKRREHRVSGTQWLAALHVRSSELSPPPALPSRGAAHYRNHMREARAVIQQNYENPVLEPVERRILDRILSLFDVTESKWSEVEALCRQVPMCLVHGDFAERNVRIRRTARRDSAPTVLAFDWEMSGWGLPIVDLEHTDLPTYWAVVRDHWCALEFDALRRLAHVGRLLRGGLAATHWSSLHLTTEWPCHAIYDMQVYDRRMTEAMRAMGWAA